jgi:hypothetical protein
MDEDTLGAEVTRPSWHPSAAVGTGRQPSAAVGSCRHSRPPYADGVPDHPLEPLAALDGVPGAVAAARAACEELRWHRALRRQWPVARTEAGVRCAHAGAEADGLRVPLDVVRDVARGAAAPPSGPDGALLRGALGVQAEVERLMAAPGATRALRVVPLGQLLARLHAVGRGAPDPDAGVPRRDAQPQDLRGLGAAPVGSELADRLALLADLVARPLPATVPALVLAAVVHGELMTLRPFASGNAAVARGVLRHLLTAGGVDPVGVVVPEAAWSARPAVHLATAAGYAAGGAAGVGAWVQHVAAAVQVGAAEGTRVADAVLAGRLAPAD